MWKPSSSGWLDRLRSSKGFPVPAGVDLEHFLSSSDTNPSPDERPPDTPDPPPPNPISGGRTPAPPDPAKSSGAEQERLSDLITNVLAELFIMGDPAPGRAPGDSKKSSRKQLRPKLRVPSASASADGSFSAACRAPAMSPASADNSVAEARKIRTKPRRKRGTVGPADADMSAYSLTEVTVIDTSSPAWKTEKLIFRKGTVWKVRDKKLWHGCRKKRKVGLVERLIGEKDREHPGPKMPALKESITLHGGCTHTDKIHASEEISDEIQVPLRRPRFSRSRRVPAAKDSHVPAAKDSSLFHLQVISSSRKIPAACSISNLKGK